MKLAGNVLFNLMLNALGSFWLALGVVLIVRSISRGRAGVLAEFALMLPFAKLLWDFVHGVPSSSFLWASEHGVQQRLGSFQIGIGATPLGPVVRGEIWAHHPHGISPQSLPDLLARALSRRVWRYAAPALGFGLLAGSILKVSLSVARLLASRARLRGIRASCVPLEARRVGWRAAQVLSSGSFAGVPFTGGLFRPYVVLPETLMWVLSAEEREAVLQHELGHVAHWDVALLLPLSLVSDWFWYVPGMSWLLGQVHALLEFRADDAALAAGVRGQAIVGALLSVADLYVPAEGPQTLAMSRGGSVLRARIQRLLAPPIMQRASGRLASVARVLVIAWLLLGALQAVACGNHPG
jgi:beta-lactamase regulating signal transducer with metallopeptidase domain